MNVLLVGTAKTGTTVISQALVRAFAPSTYVLEPKEPIWHAGLMPTSGNMVVKCIFEHWSRWPNVLLSMLYGDFAPGFSHRVLVVRDPRDEMISRLFYLAYPLAQEGVFAGPECPRFLAWLEVLRRKESAPTSLPMFAMLSEFERITERPLRRAVSGCAAEWFPWVAQHAAPSGAVVVRYEDFMAGDVVRLSAALGRPVPTDQAIDPAFLRTRRTAASGNWKRYFSGEDQSSCEAMLGIELGSIGYPDREVTPVGGLPASECSEYVLRLVQEAWSTAPAAKAGRAGGTTAT